jgi:glutathione peroxidase
MTHVLDFNVKRLDGAPANLKEYKGKVVLIVNTASECGLTPQYAGLERLHEKYKDRGLAILGFPSNDFGRQEPGTDAQISEFCRTSYGVDFDMFSKIVVKGPGQAPLYETLTTLPGFSGEIEWNFEKFLVGRDGTHRDLEIYCQRQRIRAKVAELADALDLGSSGATLEGSSPSFRIKEAAGASHEPQALRMSRRRFA